MSLFGVVLFVVGFGMGWIGLWIVIQSQGGVFALYHDDVPEPTRNRLQNLHKIMLYVERNQRVTHAEIERLAGVSSATASRYLEELEEEEMLEQVGERGPDVYYRRPREHF